MNGFVKADICRQVSVCLHVFCGILFALKPFCDYSLCSVCILPQSVFYTQSAFYPWSAVCSLRFTLTGCESRFSTRFAILYSCANWESRIEDKLSRIASRIESRRTENKRFTHDWFLDNFSKTYSCNTTRHGYIRASGCMLETRPIQVIRRMFLQGHLYQASYFLN